jgi:hypothetical protein
MQTTVAEEQSKAAGGVEGKKTRKSEEREEGGRVKGHGRVKGKGKREEG